MPFFWDIQNKAASFAKPPVIFCYSTSLLAAIEAERRIPGTFRAIVGVGGPFFLQNEKLETYLDRGALVDTFARALTFNLFSPINYGSVPVDLGDALLGTKSTRRSPCYMRLPLPTALSLRRLQLKARTAASELKTPLFYAQGNLDQVVHDKVPDFLAETVPAPIKQIKIYDNSRHGPMTGVERYKLLYDISLFLDSLLKKGRE